MEQYSHKIKMDRKQIQESYRKLSPAVQDFVMSNETTDLISSYLEKYDLTEDQKNTADSEILCLMLGLQTLDQSINNIAKYCNKNPSDFDNLKTNVQNGILDEIKKLKAGEGLREYSQENTVETKETEKFAPNSYEQILMNQAKAMRPVGVEIEGSMNYESRIMNKNVPDNLPTGEIHHHSLDNYGQNKDPYREPAE